MSFPCFYAGFASAFLLGWKADVIGVFIYATAILLISLIFTFLMPTLKLKSSRRSVLDRFAIYEDRIENLLVASRNGKTKLAFKVPFTEVAQAHWSERTFSMYFYWNKKMVGIALNVARLSPEALTILEKIFHEAKNNRRSTFNYVPSICFKEWAFSRKVIS